MALTETKSPVKSVGIVSNVIGAAAAINLILPFFGIPALPIGEAVTACVTLATAVLGIWGRWRATTKIG